MPGSSPSLPLRPRLWPGCVGAVSAGGSVAEEDVGTCFYVRACRPLLLRNSRRWIILDAPHSRSRASPWRRFVALIPLRNRASTALTQVIRAFLIWLWNQHRFHAASAHIAPSHAPALDAASQSPSHRPRSDPSLYYACSSTQSCPTGQPRCPPAPQSSGNAAAGADPRRRAWAGRACSTPASSRCSQSSSP